MSIAAVSGRADLPDLGRVGQKCWENNAVGDATTRCLDAVGITSAGAAVTALIKERNVKRAWRELKRVAKRAGLKGGAIGGGVTCLFGASNVHIWSDKK